MTLCHPGPHSAAWGHHKHGCWGDNQQNLGPDAVQMNTVVQSCPCHIAWRHSVWKDHLRYAYGIAKASVTCESTKLHPINGACICINGLCQEQYGKTYSSTPTFHTLISIHNCRNSWRPSLPERSTSIMAIMLRHTSLLKPSKLNSAGDNKHLVSRQKVLLGFENKQVVQEQTFHMILFILDNRWHIM